MFLLFLPNVLAQEDFKQVKTQVVQYWNEQNQTEANRIVKEYIDTNESKLDQRTLQDAYRLYAETFFVQQSYKEASEVLKVAIDKYDSELEKYLVTQYKDYEKYVNKPKLKGDSWSYDQKSCENQKGIWEPPQEGIKILKKGYCNLPTTDAGNKCTDSTQCQGGCITDINTPKGTKTVGKCSDRLDFGQNGCANIVTDGIANGHTCW